MHASLLLSLTLSLSILAIAAPTAASNCSSGVHIIVARGSTEPQDDGNLGMGVTKEVADLITGQVANSDAMGIVYPATLDNYPSSVAAGVGSMQAEIQRYSGACPDSRMVLLGYSQGATVVTDLLSQGIDAGAADKIIAIVGFADPTHVAGKSYDIGGATNNGRLVRTNTTVLDQYSAKMQSWCIPEDYWCDSGVDSGNGVHEREVQTNAQGAAEFVIDMAN